MDGQTDVGRILQWVSGLQRSRAKRDEQGRFWIEGVRQFLNAAEAGFEFDTIIVSRVLLKSHLVENLIRELTARGVARIRVSPEQFRQIYSTQRASGIGAVVKQRWTDLQQADSRRGLCWLVIEHLRSAGNLGTILRTAEATGVGGIIFLSGASDPFNPAVIRASMGGMFHLQMVRATHRQLRRWAAGQGALLVALAPTAQAIWTQLPPHWPMVLVLGEERHGLTEPASNMCDAIVRLPMPGRADSLNVGVAAGVMLYELVRRKISQETSAARSYTLPSDHST